MHFCPHFAHPRILSGRSPIIKLLQGSVRLTLEFFADELPEKKLQLSGISMLLILLSRRDVTPMKQWRQSQASIDNRLLGLLDTYHHLETCTFNPCSPGPTHRSLTNTGEGYNLGGVGFPHTTLRPSQSVVSPFHLRALPDLQFNQTLSTKPRC
jgi:hypothetical protein